MTDQDGVFRRARVALAMEKSSKSTWVQMNIFLPPIHRLLKRILMLREIEQEMNRKYQRQMYTMSFFLGQK
jgi:hypothetical protein